MEENPLEEIGVLNRLFPFRFGSGDLVGLGNFILNLTRSPGDPETDAENIAIAILVSLYKSTGLGPNGPTLRLPDEFDFGIKWSSGDFVKRLPDPPSPDDPASEQ